jgi:uncharacterized protein RhaS with RHS repeats
MMARYYSPSLGRFLSPDRLLSANRYAYVANNPVRLVDPLGLYHRPPKMFNDTCYECKATFTSGIQKSEDDHEEAANRHDALNALDSNSLLIPDSLMDAFVTGINFDPQFAKDVVTLVSEL